MNNDIKYKLANAMKECMFSSPVEKITVKEICDTCGVTRQTFYRVKSKFVCKFIFQLCGFIYATFIFKRFD